MARAWHVAPGVFYGERAADLPWTDQDRTWALALAEVEAGECHECKQPLDEAINEDAQWTAPPPIRCHACTAIAVRAAQYTEAKHPHALRYHATRGA